MAEAAGPAIQWQGAFGGTNADVLFSVHTTTDHGTILAGESSSGPSGNKTAPAYGGRDFWVIRLNATGEKLWDKSFGGTGDERLFSVLETSDGGLVLGGYSSSGVTGNKTDPARGQEDFWVVRVNAAGEKLWDRTFGGPGSDGLQSMLLLPDGGLLCAGFSYSNTGGNKTNQSFGGSDFWVVRLDPNGNKLWDRAYGGAADDYCYSTTRAQDGFLLAGSSSSGTSGNKTTPAFGATDFWVVRLDADGQLLWDRTFGGTADDGYYNVSLVSIPGDGFLVGGDSFSGGNGNKSKPGYGNDDYWVIALNSNGDSIWQAVHGGTGNDYLTSLLVAPDGNLLAAGGSSSHVTGNRTSPSSGMLDFWIVAMDLNGNKLWDSAYGGAQDEGYNSVTLAAAGDSILVAGDSLSGASGSKTQASFGRSDFWILKLGLAAPPTLRAIPQFDVGSQGFRLYLQGQSSKTYRVEYTTDFSAWTPLSTNILSATEVEILDPGARTNSARFYRAREWQ